MALLADLAFGSGLLAALMVALLARFNGGFAAALLVSLLVVGFGDGEGSEERGSANGNGQGLDELHMIIESYIIIFCSKSSRYRGDSARIRKVSD